MSEIANKSFKEIVGEAIGEASMCWSEAPCGVFDSTRASALADKVVNYYNRKAELQVLLMGHISAMRPLLDEWHMAEFGESK